VILGIDSDSDNRRDHGAHQLRISISIWEPQKPADEESARHIPNEMIGRLLDQRDLRQLQRALTRKKPPAPSVLRRTTSKRAAAR